MGWSGDARCGVLHSGRQLRGRAVTVTSTPAASAAITGAWHVRGTYFEACNCDAICPCRREGGVKKGLAPTYDLCEFALSWLVTNGRADAVDLAGVQAVLIGAYTYSEQGMPWRVTL